MAEALRDPDSYRHPDQPTLIYDNTQPWEKVAFTEPNWLSYERPPLPPVRKFDFLGEPLVSPLVIAAGPAYDQNWTDFYLSMGYGIVVAKMRRTVPVTANQAPNLAIVQMEGQMTRENMADPVQATLDPEAWKKYQAMTNSYGNPSNSVEDRTYDMHDQKSAVNDGQKLFVSVTATVDEERTMAKILGEDSEAIARYEAIEDLTVATAAAVAQITVYGDADGIEENLACPNVLKNQQEGQMYQDSRIVKGAGYRFKRIFPKVPFGFKYGIYESKDQMKRVIGDAGEYIDFVSGLNALAKPVVDQDGNPILPGRLMSGVCGKPLLNLALEHTEWAAQIREELGLKYGIMGGGGVTELEDPDRFMDVGADVVFIASKALEDPYFNYRWLLHKGGVY